VFTEGAAITFSKLGVQRSKIRQLRLTINERRLAESQETNANFQKDEIISAVCEALKSIAK
jgi:hypothetical protein